MADPSGTISRSFYVDKERHVRVIKNAEALTVGALLAHNFTLGKTEFADDVSDLAGIGVCIGQADGNNLLLTGDSGGTRSAVSRGGIVLEKVVVTGVSAITDIGKFVYATDGQTLTLTRPTSGVPYGIVTRWYSSTTCDVYLFGFVESVLLSLMNPTKQLVSFGTFLTNALQGNSAVTLWSETSREHYKINSFHAQCVAHDNAVVAGSQILTLAINDVATTGGALTLAYTNADAAADMGVAINSTSITAGNEVHAGDVLKINMGSGGTGFTADVVAAFKLYAEIEKLPGA